MRLPASAERLTWAAAALLFSAAAVLFYRDTPPPPIFALAIGALAVLGAIGPRICLVLITAFVPLGSILVALLPARAEFTGARLAEGLALALLTGWAIHRTAHPRRIAVPAPLAGSAVALIALALASGAVAVAEYIAEVRGTFDVGILRAFAPQLSLAAGSPGAAMVTAGTIALMIAVADITAGNPDAEASVARATVIGASTAAIFNLLRIILLAVAREDPLRAFFSLLATMRVSVHFGDVNAAGSYFALAAVLGLALIPGFRKFGLLGAGFCGLGLWISGSRAAMLAAFIAAALAGLSATRTDPRRRNRIAMAVVLTAAALAAATWLWYPAGRNGPLADTIRMRRDNWTTALRMTAAKPVFGIGVGNFYTRAQEYGPVQENAHNNYLQILAELGVPGLVLFLLVVTLAVGQGLRRPAGSAGWAVAWGVVAFLLTCLLGHPLLIPLVAYPFWIAVGIIASRPSPPKNERQIHSGLVVIAAIVLIAGTIPFRISAAVRDANRENASIGLSQWQRDTDGSRLRWAGARSAFYVPASAHWVRIPLRHGGIAPGPLRVRISIDDREADQVVLEPDGRWRSVRVVIARRTTARWMQIRVEAEGLPRELTEVQPTGRSGLLAIGRAVVE